MTETGNRPPLLELPPGRHGCRHSEFRIPNSGFVALTIYNVKGQVVKRPIGQVMSAGIYQYRLDGNDLASGIYYYQLVAGDFREVKKMILIR